MELAVVNAHLDEHHAELNAIHALEMQLDEQEDPMKVVGVPSYGLIRPVQILDWPYGDKVHLSLVQFLLAVAVVGVGDTHDDVELLFRSLELFILVDAGLVGIWVGLVGVLLSVLVITVVTFVTLAVVTVIAVVVVTIVAAAVIAVVVITVVAAAVLAIEVVTTMVIVVVMAAIVAVTVLVYFQDKMGWKVGFMVPAAIMTSVTLLNLAVSPFYVKVKPQTSMWAGLLKVALAAVNNRDLELPEANHHGVQFHSLPGSTQVVPSEKMRFLNKACLVRTRAGSSTNNEGSDSTCPRCTCTVEQVENLKSALSVMPMWSAMVMSFLLQSSSFGVLQAATTDRRIGTTRFQIPAGSISIFEITTFTVWSGCYDSYVLPLLRRVTGRQRVLTLKQRMGIGLFLAVVSMAVASAVEARRREAATRQGALRMSALWLAPQYVLMGLAGAFGAIAQIEFYYAVLPKSMGSFVLALLFFGGGVASIMGTVIIKLVNVVTGGGGAVPWISDDLDRGRYDCYYRLLAVLGAIDFVYFVVCAYVFNETAQNMSLEVDADDEAEEAVESTG
ncbi:protein NRT1/ PTR FAMILY 1.2 [Setaria italica]|uniref:protein NRT1/ PTR FAMILY 1.2 n=1 Tax=Setaria italica TaxID=4555 RepID=UPI000646F49D|nr:protein NRT1/ PTR FAMILY 1.2 [Setaria italica]